MSLKTTSPQTQAARIISVSTEEVLMPEVCHKLGFPYENYRSLRAVTRKLENPDDRPDLILFELTQQTTALFRQLRHYMLKDSELATIPFVAVSFYPSLRWRRLCRKFRVKDYLLSPLIDHQVRSRLLGQLPAHRRPLNTGDTTEGRQLSWRRPGWKRAFDLLGASVLMLLLSPVFLLIMLAIKLESRGPVFYISPRAGQGFQVFPFIKFRSMRVDADRLVAQLKQQNQYAQEQEDIPADVLRSKPTQKVDPVLIYDQGYIFESSYQIAHGEGSTFFKMKNDPRITRIGCLLRNTSLDELPQLFNVLRGDMSLVGNRPLPLYEAEQLTQDDAILRFAAPAGITGLWQVSKRGKEQMSAAERKQLDKYYALRYNFWLDLKILWRTLPAAIQKETV